MGATRVTVPEITVNYTPTPARAAAAAAATATAAASPESLKRPTSLVCALAYNRSRSPQYTITRDP